ncbi:MAG: mechanosensitive ion channel family protein [Gammaproteobacteria bacterium]|nr:mechanosensitive ion channel family protein [Gammaproteobacteria bacterium]
MRLRRSTCLFALILMLLTPLAVSAADAETTAAVPPEPPPAALASPRATMATFLSAMNDIKRGDPARIDDAIATLDLDDVNALVRRERGTDLAWMLLDVMDRTRLVDLDTVPARDSGRPWVFHRYASGVVRIARQADGRWQFDRDTLARLPALHDELADRARVVGDDEDAAHLPFHLRIRAQLPDSLKQPLFLLETWHWLGLLLIAAVGVVVDMVVSLVLRLFMRGWRQRSGDGAFRDVSDKMLRPLGLVAMAAVWWVGINLLGLPERALLVLLVAVKFLASAAGVWTAYRLVDLVSAGLHRRAQLTDNKVDDVLAPLITRTLKIFVTVVGLIFVADNLNIDVTGLIAGLGLGGLAFALAAKDMVQNLFGSITVLMDRTFTVGDWIKVGDQEGTVEALGFRSTRIRTFYNSVVTVPNSHFITANVDNMGERRFRRLSTKFTIAYATPPDRIEAFCEGVREIVRQHPYMRRDYYHVYLNGLGDSALEILVYVFWETPDWSTELRERHRFLVDCLRLAERLGVDYAFPTQTLHLQRGGAAPAGESEAPDAAREHGAALAREVVDYSTGLGERPPPVRFR